MVGEWVEVPEPGHAVELKICRWGVVGAPPDKAGVSAEGGDEAPIESCVAKGGAELFEDRSGRVGAVDGIVGLGDDDSAIGEGSAAVLVER